MTQFTLDACVAIKWFVPEIHTNAALKLLTNDIDHIVPDLIFPEFSNIVWKKCRLKELHLSIATEIIKAFRSYRLKVIHSRYIYELAFDLASRFDCTVYDCMYLAAACVTDTQLVTADKKFFNKINATTFANKIAWVESLLD